MTVILLVIAVVMLAFGVMFDVHGRVAAAVPGRLYKAFTSWQARQNSLAASEARKLNGLPSVEEEQTNAALDALTETDVELMKALGWTPPARVDHRLAHERRVRLHAEAKARRQAFIAAAETDTLTSEQLEEYKRRPLAERQDEADARIAGTTPELLRLERDLQLAQVLGTSIGVRDPFGQPPPRFAPVPPRRLGGFDPVPWSVPDAR